MEPVLLCLWTLSAAHLNLQATITELTKKRLGSKAIISVEHNGENGATGKITTSQCGLSHSSPSSHRGQTAPLLTYDGTATQEPSDHHQPPGQDQDVGGHGECTGGQQAQVLSFIDQRPDPNPHYHPTAHLKEKNTSEVIIVHRV